jgi:tripartite-type tricarboxylate transporter receptor subunit TctC
MNKRHWLLAMTACAASWAAAQPAPAAFPGPDRTIRIVVPFAAGGGVDSAARLLADQMRRQLNVSVIVDNKAGASGTLGGRYVQNAPADGYTLLFSAATQIHTRQVMKNPPYDPQTDFAPVARIGEAPLMLVIAPQQPEQKLPEVLKAAGAKPEAWTAALPAFGAPSHLATLLLAKEGKVSFAYIPYKGTQPALVDVAGNQVQLLLDSMISLLPMARSGNVKPIAVTSRKRSPLLPQVPTIAESGLPQFSYASWYGLWAPRGTPPERIALLNKAANAAVGELVRSGAFASLGIDPVNESPEQFRRYIASDVEQGAELLRSSGFKPE